jgi:hypothetical protein
LRPDAAQTIVPRMSETATAAGWVVQLTIPGLPRIPAEGAKWRPAETMAPTFQFFNVAIGSADKAVEAARKKTGASDEAVMRVVRALSASELDSIKLRTGEAKPA